MSEKNDPVAAIAAQVKREREARGWSLADLADRSGVSKAMISKIERVEASPTATVLGRLSGAFGVSLSTLMTMAEAGGGRVAEQDRQPVWTDPETGYSRRRISPSGSPFDLIEVCLPPRVTIPYPAAAFAFQHQQIWLLSGMLEFQEGAMLHRLHPGDCLLLGPPADCVFFNSGDELARYLVALTHR